jgi:thymidylate synthase (FAD)
VRLIFKPTIISAWSTVPHLDNDEFVDYFGNSVEQAMMTNHGDFIPEVAGRLCYQSFTKPRPGGNAAYLERILSEGHGSVLEHATIGFIIHGVSRSLTHELIRHKAGTAVSELSQRFVDASDLGFVVPPKWVGEMFADGRTGTAPHWFTACIDWSSKAYAGLTNELGVIPVTTLERKRIRESARSVLPNCVETHIAFSGNLRAWRNILEQRGNIHADLEIRRLAVALLEPLKLYAPNVFQDFDIVVDEDGRESVVNKWRKV